MSGEGFDLTGEWSGIYNFPHTLPPNAFEASIRDAGGIITGVIRQPGEFFEPPGTRQHAVIEGTREGTRVRWIKIYDDLARSPPRYEGTIQPGIVHRIQQAQHISSTGGPVAQMVHAGIAGAAGTHAKLGDRQFGCQARVFRQHVARRTDLVGDGLW